MFSPPVLSCSSCLLGIASPGRCPFTPTHLDAGVVVCNQGEKHSTVYFVREGSTALSAVNADGSERSFSVRGARSMLCTETLRGAPSAYEVRALTDVKLCVLSAAAVMEWIGPESSPGRALVELALGEVKQQQEDVQWRRGGCLSRVARFALACAPLSAAAARQVLKKQLVARMLGMRPETLSRCLRRLSDAGLVNSSSGVQILDAPGLAAVAMNEAA